MNTGIHSVLFDLDGTLLDTAQDLANALNAVLQNNRQATLPFEQIRPVVSHGGQALIQHGFNIGPDHPEFGTLKKQLLDYYQSHIAEHTTLFPGMDEVLKRIERRGLKWGVVTNKPTWLTEPLLDAMDLSRRAAAVVCGDTLNERKPHPAPLLHACSIIGCKPDSCLYIGDAERDIKAGHQAGMSTLVALFGYLMAEDEPEAWGATALIEHPSDILAWIENECC